MEDGLLKSISAILKLNNYFGDFTDSNLNEQFEVVLMKEKESNPLFVLDTHIRKMEVLISDIIKYTNPSPERSRMHGFNGQKGDHYGDYPKSYLDKREYNLCHKYITFLKSIPVEKPMYEPKRDTNKYPEKWYGYTYAIRVTLGKEAKPMKDKKGGYVKSKIIENGKILYGTGEGFYRGFLDLMDSINNMSHFIGSMDRETKDRKNWKKIITDISKNDADVINWLTKQPK